MLYTKIKTQIIIVSILFCVGLSCISPEAVKTEVQGIRSDLNQLEKIVDQKADNNVVADHIDQINNRIDQTTQVAENLSVWKKRIEAQTINYSGAGWVVIGTGIIVIIFVGAGLLLIRAFMRRGNLLTLLTCAIQKVGKSTPQTANEIKNQLKREVANGKFSEQDRQDLGRFARKKGTFAEKK